MTYSQYQQYIQSTIIYPRKSREDEQREKETGEDCLQIMTEVLVNTCKRLGVENYVVKPEIGSADTIDGRPVFREILEKDMPSGRYDSIAVREISRLGRGNFADAGRIYNAIIKNKIYIITPTKIYDPNNKSDLRSIRFELFLSREEYELTKDRLWYGRDEKAKKGYAPNYVATLGIESIRGKFIIIPEEAELVREIFEMRANEKSYQEIANILNSRGIKTKKGTKYHHSTIYKILKNKRYIGISVWMGKEYESQCPPIVSMELWNKVHNEIQPLRTITKQNGDIFIAEPYCKECGNRMYGELGRCYQYKNGKIVKTYDATFLYYRCIGRRKDPKCIHQIRGEQLHEAIFVELKKLVDNKEFLKTMLEERNKTFKHGKNDLEESLKSLQKKLRQKEVFVSKLDNDYATGELNALLYTKHYEQTDREIKHISGQIEQVKKTIRSSNVVIQPPKELINNLKRCLAQWDDISGHEKKKIIKAFFPRIEISKDGQYYVSPVFPVSFDF